MRAIAFFDAKPYDRQSFSVRNESNSPQYDIRYFDSKLTSQTAALASGCEGVCAFVNDVIDEKTVKTLYDLGVRIIAMRCAGYSNVDLLAAYGKIRVARVPAYSPHAVAEHAMGLLLAVNRKLHKAHNRTHDFNFNIAGLTGIDLYKKTVGVIGTGRIGRVFMQICEGFGMRVVAYDLYPDENSDINYVPLDELIAVSDVISLHCPLSEQSRHILNERAFSLMKSGVYIINTSRGALIDAGALLRALNDGRVRGAGLDVYEEEADYFYEDRSQEPIRDDVLSLLLSRPNVLLTSHQAFLTEEALKNIASSTLKNFNAFFAGEELSNEVSRRREPVGINM